MAQTMSYSDAVKANGLHKIVKESAELYCILCSRSTVNEPKFGVLYEKSGTVVHLFCLLSSTICPRLVENEGIVGFRIEDIRNEANRLSQDVRSLNLYTCSFCKKPGAAVGCKVLDCNKHFHYPCGIEHGVAFTFKGNRCSSLCDKHVGSHANAKTPYVWARTKCSICSQSLGECQDAKVVSQGKPVAISCCKNSTFHKDCLQKYALEAGTRFKCLCCGDIVAFHQEANENGIYTTRREASWLSDPKLYSNDENMYFTCDAAVCKCKKGRNVRKSSIRSELKLIPCVQCGLSGIHNKCWVQKNRKTTWTCSNCRPAVAANLEKDMEN